MALLTTLFQIAIGGALGAVFRFLIATGVIRATGAGLPLGILTVNVLGSFLMGVAVMLFTHKIEEVHFAPLVMTGFLGGFTTFSAFSLDTVNLIERGEFVTAALYVIGSVVLSVMALALGMFATKGWWL